jgi:hypothetical protein
MIRVHSARGTIGWVSIRSTVAVVGIVGVCVLAVVVLLTLTTLWRWGNLLVTLRHHSVRLLDFAFIVHFGDAGWWCHLRLWVSTVLAVTHHWLALGVLTRLGRRAGVHGSRAIEALTRCIRHALLNSSWGSAGRRRGYGASVTQSCIDGKWLSALGVLDVAAVPFIRASLISHAHDARSARGRSWEGVGSVNSWTARRRMRLNGVRGLGDGTANGVAHRVVVM